MDTGTPALTLSQTRLLATVIKTTRNMVGLADQQAWDAVADLEMLRREDLKRCFEMPLQEDKGELVAEALAVLLHLNEELASKLLRAREQAREASRGTAKGRDAVSEYREMNIVR
tara:strand:- start:1407 stop:1751 length:345 start_codon:yes stop_codon:yes gene_type:complete